MVTVEFNAFKSPPHLEGATISSSYTDLQALDRDLVPRPQLVEHVVQLVT